MASSKVPRVQCFQLVEGMQLQINISGWLHGRNVRVELQIKNCTRTWILHWGFIYRGNANWFVPTYQASGAKKGALQTPFTKSGDLYVVNIELRDPKIHAIEFVLKDGGHDRWLKLNNGNFRVELPEHDESTIYPPVSKDLLASKAYPIWENKGRPINSPQKQKFVQKNCDDALRKLQSQFSKGSSLDDLKNSCTNASINTSIDTRVQCRSGMPSAYQRRHDVERWLHRPSFGHARSANMPFSSLMDLVDITVVVIVLTKVINCDYHIFVGTSIKGTVVLHWGVSKLSSGEWLAPAPEMLPGKSKLVAGACQTYFSEMSTRKGFFQVDRNGKGIAKYLLDEISRREKEAERSLMHRFNIATELTERSKVEGELGLIGILVWLRFMACRHLTWNKNYNVKPREISEAQDRFTNLLQRIYLNQPNDREIVRLILSCVGRGGQGDVGQRIRDEILLVQRNNDCKTGMMEEWHQKLHNNTSPDDVIICEKSVLPCDVSEALLNYVRCGFRIDVYWQTLKANGLTKKKLASYDRPIVSEPHFPTDAREGLTRDLTMYLKTLKAVHSGADLESAIEALLGSSSKGRSLTSSDRGIYVSGLPQKLQDSLNFVRAHVADENIDHVSEVTGISHRASSFSAHISWRRKDLLFPDLALTSAVRTTMEKGLKDLSFAHLPDIMFYIALVLENLCLSSVNNEDLVYGTKYCICESYKPIDGLWALQAKAGLDRLQLVLADRSQIYHDKIQPSVQYLGNLLGIEKWVRDIFTEELIRMGSAALLSTLINRLDPIPRKFANLGCGGYGYDTVGAKSCNIKFLRERVPSWIKIPISVALPFGTFETVLSEDVNKLEAKNLWQVWYEAHTLTLIVFPYLTQPVACYNVASTSFAGDIAKRMSSFYKSALGGDLAKLQAMRDAVQQIRAPLSLIYELKSKMRSSRISWPGDESEERKANLNHENLCMAVLIQEVICGDYAFVIHTKNPLSGDTSEIYAEIVKGLGETLVGAHPGRAMSFLAKKSNLKFPIVRLYPLYVPSLDASLSLDKKASKNVGLYSKPSIIFRSDSNGEDLEGYAGAGLYDRNMQILVLHVLSSIVANRYNTHRTRCSVLMDEEEKLVLDYSSDRIIVDKAFQTSLFSKIVEAGKVIENLYGCFQDIEGVVKDGAIYVVQARPQI
ncbi:unnamed protein product [Dovyalis caffra]|uniref:Pyruvate phosphate dikinase AMP/ATP-binding domain-containing protein n=1 Tax=Dovyalis caffra TaxID=77055 RepID=A0AAV1SAK4_9ROSI|nr:unnamed protein product [Dovyalis caffra]